MGIVQRLGAAWVRLVLTKCTNGLVVMYTASLFLVCVLLLNVCPLCYPRKVYFTCQGAGRHFGGPEPRGKTQGS